MNSTENIRLERTRVSAKIPLARLDQLQEEIKRLNRRAAKLGVEPLEVTLGETSIAERQLLQEDRVPIGATVIRRQGRRIAQWPVREVTVVGQTPVLQGWSLLAVLHPLADAETGTTINVVKAVPGCETLVPESWRTADPKCDHCQTIRRRNETFLVRHEDGRIVQVGRQCIADFLGHASAERLLAWASWTRVLSDLEGGDDDCGGGPRGRQVWSLQTFLEVAAALTLEIGFTSRKAEKEDWTKRATAGLVEEALTSHQWRVFEGEEIPED